MSTGKEIKLYLIEKNISQAWLSEETKIAPAKLSSSLNDKRKLSIEEYTKIIQSLKLPANKFIRES